MTAALIAVSVSTANASTLAITNAGFENPPLAEGAATSFATGGTTAIAGWLITGFAGGDGATFNPNAGHPGFPSGAVPEGLNAAYAESATLSQTLTATLTAGNYQLSVFIGNPADRTDSADPASFDLYLPSTGRIVLSSAAIAMATIPNGTFVDFSANGDIASGDADIGRQLGIRLHTGSPISPTGPYFAFDNVRLSYAVPLPPAWALPLSGLSALGLIRRVGLRGQG